MPLSPGLATSAEALLAPRIESRIVPGLERMRAALAALGHPERDLPAVLVVGTNGKGSTAALLASVLGACGLRVGMTTSPHLVRVEERIRVSGTRITTERLLEHLGELRSYPELSYFETVTTAAILEFAASGVDVAVLEAGLGGRWDASNVVDPEVALLTNVGTDHQAWLGDTRVAIAAEKAAALRGREIIVGEWDTEVEGSIRAAADPAAPISLASQWAQVTRDERPGTANSGPGSGIHVSSLSCAHRPRPLSPVSCPLALSGTPIEFSVLGRQGRAVLPLAGDHQLPNLTLALAAAAALAKHGLMPALSVETVAQGIQSVRWPGRLQWLEQHGRALLLDGAHNREAVAALARSVSRLGLPRLDLLFSCLADKPLAEMAALLRPLVANVTVVPLSSPRAMDINTLAAAFPGCRLACSVEAALASLPIDRPVLVTGSLRLVGEVLTIAGVHDA